MIPACFLAASAEIKAAAFEFLMKLFQVFSEEFPLK